MKAKTKTKLVAMMTDTEDPWKPLSPPSQMTDVSGRRVDQSLPWNVYWALDMDRRCLLVFRHSPENSPARTLPRLQGLEVTISAQQQNGQSLLVIRLKDNGQREVFHHLCLDMIEATRATKTEQQAIERFIARIWRWHWLLRGGRDGRLPEEVQKGIIGELQLMQGYLFSVIGVEAAVRSWMGPLGAPKDFEIGHVCIEVKSRKGSAVPFVSISTQHQLDTEGVDALFLYVVEVVNAPGSDPNGITLTDQVVSVQQKIQGLGAAVADLFEQRLMAVGFDRTHDYTDTKWLIGQERLFKVSGDFPRVTPSMYPSGVEKVRYEISLSDCEPYRVDRVDVTPILKGERDVD